MSTIDNIVKQLLRKNKDHELLFEITNIFLSNDVNKIKKTMISRANGMINLFIQINILILMVLLKS